MPSRYNAFSEKLPLFCSFLYFFQTCMCSSLLKISQGRKGFVTVDLNPLSHTVWWQRSQLKTYWLPTTMTWTHFYMVAEWVAPCCAGNNFRQVMDACPDAKTFKSFGNIPSNSNPQFLDAAFRNLTKSGRHRDKNARTVDWKSHRKKVMESAPTYWKLIPTAELVVIPELLSKFLGKSGT